MCVCKYIHIHSQTCVPWCIFMDVEVFRGTHVTCLCVPRARRARRHVKILMTHVYGSPTPVSSVKHLSSTAKPSTDHSSIPRRLLPDTFIRALAGCLLVRRYYLLHLTVPGSVNMIRCREKYIHISRLTPFDLLKKDRQTLCLSNKQQRLNSVITTASTLGWCKIYKT